MKVLFDFVHPAQVHFFKNAIRCLKQRGDEVVVTARQKDVTIELLKALDIEHTCISEKGSNMLAMGFELLARDLKLIKIVRKFKPDVMVGRVGVSIGPVGKLLGVPTVIYDDMEKARLQAAIGMTFATYICTGLGYYRDFGKRHVKFAGLHVLSYLSPKYFRPDPEPLKKAGLDPADKYIFVRTVSWGASHDVGKTGSSDDQLKKIIDRLSKFGRVVISSEEPLGESLKQYENPVPVDQMHNLLAYAGLCLVEGGTMAAEAVALGVPTICLETYDFGYLNALWKDYEMISMPDSFDAALDEAERLLSKPDLKQFWKQKQQRLLDESDDVTEFMVEMIDRAALEYPVAGNE
ncbi:MAG: DUF354 domain-containing protein [Planctomycetes bacterium]|nr:DUF354 domain-containing protein [Planctomycetota bacterium]